MIPFRIIFIYYPYSINRDPIRNSRNISVHFDNTNLFIAHKKEKGFANCTLSFWTLLNIQNQSNIAHDLSSCEEPNNNNNRKSNNTHNNNNNNTHTTSNSQPPFLLEDIWMEGYPIRLYCDPAKGRIISLDFSGSINLYLLH